MNEAAREWEAAKKISYHDGRWSNFYSDLEMGFGYSELMSEIDLQLATLYKQQHKYRLAATAISSIIDGRAGDVVSTECNKYVSLAESLLAGTFNANRVPADLRN